MFVAQINIEHGKLRKPRAYHFMQGRGLLKCNSQYVVRLTGEPGFASIPRVFQARSSYRIKQQKSFK